MSGCSGSTVCPNCGADINVYTDWKPYDMVDVGPCYDCGFYAYTKAGFLNLEELNQAREEHNDLYGYEGEDRLEPLTELPEQDKNI